MTERFEGGTLPEFMAYVGKSMESIGHKRAWATNDARKGRVLVFVSIDSGITKRAIRVLAAEGLLCETNIQSDYQDIYASHEDIVVCGLVDGLRALASSPGEPAHAPSGEPGSPGEG